MNIQEIERWLIEMNIKNYVIHKDFSINVKGNVDLSKKDLSTLPYKFDFVEGYFDCSYNNLTDLSNVPNKIGKGFYCNNNNLTSLLGATQDFNGSFNCSNNKLTNLKYTPLIIQGDFDFHNNKIESLYYFPIEIHGSVQVDYVKDELNYLNKNTKIFGKISGTGSDLIISKLEKNLLENSYQYQLKNRVNDIIIENKNIKRKR